MTPRPKNQPPDHPQTPAPKRWLILSSVLIGGWLVFLGLTSWRYSTPGSPDEAGNALIARQLAATNTYRVPVALSPRQLEVYRPRSLSTQGSTLTSGSFLGFVQVQAAGQRLFGDAGPIVVTLALLAGAIIALYRIGRRYWEWPWALLACGLIATMPAVAIFNTLPWHHAAIFTSLLVLTGLAVLRFQEHQTIGRAMIIGAVYGLALMIRPVDVLFTGPAVAVVMLAHHRGWLYGLIALGVALVVQLPWLIAGWHLFGGFLATGYTTTGISPTSDGQAGLAWWRIFVPPGGWSWHFWQAGWEGIVTPVPAVSAMAILSLVAYVRRKFTSLKKVVKIGAVSIFTVYYIVYYGSLDLRPLTFTAVGFQISYIRYWLPLMAAMAAGVMVFLRGLSGLPRRTGILLGLTVILANAVTTIWHDSGFVGQARRDASQVAIQRGVLAATEPTSMIVAYNYDKVLVGRRLTSYRGPMNDSEWQLLAEIVAERPTYMLVTPVSPPLDQLASGAAQQQLRLERLSTISDATLWRLTSETGT